MKAAMDDNAPLVSVLILSHDRPPGVDSTLQMIRTQSYKNLEIIVSDDCSENPDVMERIKHHCQRDSRIVCHQQDSNLGIIENHRYTRNLANGKYMMWACDDDWWHRDYIASAVNALEKHPHAVLCASSNVSFSGIHDEEYNYENVNTLGIKSPIERFIKILRSILWSNQTFYGLLRTSVAKKVELRNRLAFDIFFVSEMAIEGEFVQLHNYFFDKKPGGNGQSLQGNLKAIKVDKLLVKTFPHLSFVLGMTSFLWRASRLSAGDKIRHTFPVIDICISNEPFITDKCSWISLIHNLPARLYHRTHYMQRYRIIPDHDWVKKSFQWNVKNEEIEYRKETDSIYLPKLDIAFRREDSDIVKEYQRLLYFKREYNVHYERQDLYSNIVMHHGNLQLILNSGETAFIFEEVFLNHCYNFVSQGKFIAIDIGMNVGVASMFFAMRRQVKRVYGFELFSPTAAIARKNLSLNPELSAKIEIFEIGLDNRDHREKLKYSPVFPGLCGKDSLSESIIEHKQVTVEQQPVCFNEAAPVIGEILARHPNEQKLLKIDCEGGEYAILKNLKDNKVLCQFDLVMLEWHRDGDQQIVEHLKSDGFTVFSVDHKYTRTFGSTGMIYAVI